MHSAIVTLSPNNPVVEQKVTDGTKGYGPQDLFVVVFFTAGCCDMAVLSSSDFFLCCMFLVWRLVAEATN